MPGEADRRLARGAAVALLDAIASLRQHPGNTGLHHAVLRKAHAALRAATTLTPLVLDLLPTPDHDVHDVHATENRVSLADDRLRAPTANGHRRELPFGPLRAAGVGELVLLPGVTPPELHCLAWHLAAMSADDDPEQTVRRLQRDPGLGRVLLRAAATSARSAGGDEALDWTALPTVATRSPELTAMVARDLAGNLPALVTRQILDDLAMQPGIGERTLGHLLPRLLDRGDLATASWLLAEVTHDAPHLADELRRIAAARADERWLTQLLTQGTRDELMQLCTFVMQLPDEVPMRFAALLASTAHPLARWLRDLLG